MRRLLLPALAAVALAPGALAQGADTTAAARGGADAPRTTTLLLPNETGVFYYRAGPPGGLRVRSRNGRPVRPGAAVRRGPTVLQPIIVDGGGGGGLSRLDLELLERDLIDAIDDRLDALLDAQRRRTDYVPPAPRAPLVVPRPAPADRAEDAPADPAPVVRPGTPRPAPPAAGEDVVTVEEVERALLDTGLFSTSRVNFEFGEAALIPASRDIADAVADVLRRYPALRVRVGGHTDAVGSDAFNLRLSQDRAQAVVDYLVGAGVAADRLVAVGYGEREPIASNDTETGRALNRRVAFTVLNPEAAETVRRSTTTEAEGVDRDRVREILREELDRLRRERDGGDDG